MTLRPITFRLREVYGNRRAYPVCPVAAAVCDLAGSKTLRPRDIETVLSLGFEPTSEHGEPITSRDLD